MKVNFLKSVGISYSAVLITSLISFITVPIALNYFGKEMYGLFAITSDTLAYLALFSFGIPFATGTIFAKTSNPNLQTIIINKALKILFIISIIGFICLIIVNYYMSNYFAKFFSIPNNILTTAKLFVQISIIFFIIRLPFTLFNQLLIFANKVYISKIFDVINSISNLFILMCIVIWHLSIILFACMSGVVSTLIIIANVIMFKKVFKPGDAQFVSTDNDEKSLIRYKYLLTSGFYFFINSIGVLILSNTSNLVISHYLGLAAVAKYALVFKIYLVMFMVITQLMMVINPLYPKLYREKDFAKLQKLYKMTNILFPIAGGAMFIFMFGFLKEFIVLWTHNDTVFAGYLTCCALGLYCYFTCSTIIPFSVLASLNFSKQLYKLTLLEAVLNLGLSVFLVTKIGIAGVAFASLIAQITTMFFLAPRTLKKLTNNLLVFDFKFVFKHIIITIIPLVIILNLLNRYIEVNLILKALYIFIVLLLYLGLCYLLINRLERKELLDFLWKRNDRKETV